MSNIQKQHKISPAIAWLTIQKFIIFYCPLDGEHTIPVVEAWGVFVTKVWERDWKIRQIESDVKDERVVYVKKEQKREFVW